MPPLPLSRMGEDGVAHVGSKPGEVRHVGSGQVKVLAALGSLTPEGGHSFAPPSGTLGQFDVRAPAILVLKSSSEMPTRIR